MIDLTKESTTVSDLVDWVGDARQRTLDLRPSQQNDVVITRVAACWTEMDGS